MTPPVVTLNDLRAFALEHNLVLTESELQERLTTGSTSSSNRIENHLHGFFSDLISPSIGQ